MRLIEARPIHRILPSTADIARHAIEKSVVFSLAHLVRVFIPGIAVATPVFDFLLQSQGLLGYVRKSFRIHWLS
jgi:hypothetical protein